MITAPAKTRPKRIGNNTRGDEPFTKIGFLESRIWPPPQLKRDIPPAFKIGVGAATSRRTLLLSIANVDPAVSFVASVMPFVSLNRRSLSVKSSQAQALRSKDCSTLFAKIDTAQSDAGRIALELAGEEFPRRALFDPITQPQELLFALVGAVRGTCSRSSIAETLMAQGISRAPSSMENSITIRLNSQPPILPCECHLICLPADGAAVLQAPVMFIFSWPAAD